MNDKHPVTVTSGGPVEAALADYFQRLDRGESVALTEIIAAHPGCEEGLREFLDQEHKIQEMVSSSGQHPDQPARTLGDFRLLRELGRGGMGIVYEAEQLSLGRRVAVKVLPHAVMLDQRQLTRFKNEARAAATLDHTHIVAVYAVGCEQDVHFYAMQLIAGQSLAHVIADLRSPRQPLPSPTQKFTAQRSTNDRPVSTDYSQDAVAPGNAGPTLDEPPSPSLPLAEAESRFLPGLPEPHSQAYYRRVAQLGMEAATALEHAHQHGILHRDIKPGNLLLGEDGKLRVTDFGLARIEADAGMTITGDLIGTLRYMSPEQTRGGRAVVDHRSDIYSLGATLYELLTLQPAFLETDRADLLRQIADEEPRLPRQILRRIPVDLETIVRKAMSKDPTDRYASAQELADDLQRFLDDKSILAQPPSVWQRLNRWSRRHVAIVWAALASSLLVTLVLLASTALVLQAYREANAERENAERESARAEAALVESDAARQEAVFERDQAEAVTDFVVRALQAQDPHHQGQKDLTVAQAMAQAVEQLDQGDLAEQPATVARLLICISGILAGNGRDTEAEPLAERALLLQRQLHSGDSPEVARALGELAHRRYKLGRASEAEPMYKEVLQTFQRLYGESDHLELAEAMHNLAVVKRVLGRWDEAEDLYMQCLGMQRRLLGDNHPSVARTLMNLAGVHVSFLRLADAELHYKEALDIFQQHYPDGHPYAAACLSGYAELLELAKRLDEAAAYLEQSIEMNQRFFDSDHPSTAVGLSTLASVQFRLGHFEEAERHYETALQIFQRMYPDGHPNILAVLDDLASLSGKLGRLVEAESFDVQALELARRLYPEDHPQLASALLASAKTRRQAGRLAEAELVGEEALAMQKRIFQEDHYNVAEALYELAYVKRSLGKMPEAQALFVEAHEMQQRIRPFVSFAPVANRCEEFELYSEAEPLWRKAVEAFEAKWPPEDWRIALAQVRLGSCLLEQEKYTEAEPRLLQGFAWMLAAGDSLPDDARPLFTLAAQSLVKLYEASERPDEAKHWSEQLSNLADGSNDPAAD